MWSVYWVGKLYLLIASLFKKNNITLTLLRAWPCGVVPLWDELFGSEGMRQVYGIILEWLKSLSEEDRKRILYILYDDMCHLKVN